METEENNLKVKEKGAQKGKEKGTRKETNKEDVGIHVLLTIFFFAFLGLIVFMVLHFAFELGGLGGNISTVLPGTVLFELAMIFLVPLGLAALLAVPGILMSRLYIRLAHVMKLKRFEVAIQRFEEKRILTARKVFSRGLVSMLFSLAISLSINNMVFDLGFELITGSRAYSIAALASLLMPFAVLIMTPTWFLKDAGIIFYKPLYRQERKRSRISRETYDVASVGTYYDYIFKGFLGITTPFMYAYAFLSGDEFSTDFLLTLVVTLGPILMIGVVSLPTWIYMKIFPKFEVKFLKRAKFKKINMEIRLE